MIRVSRINPRRRSSSPNRCGCYQHCRWPCGRCISDLAATRQGEGRACSCHQKTTATKQQPVRFRHAIVRYCCHAAGGVRRTYNRYHSHLGLRGHYRRADVISDNWRRRRGECRHRQSGLAAAHGAGDDMLRILDRCRLDRCRLCQARFGTCLRRLIRRRDREVRQSRHGLDRRGCRWFGACWRCGFGGGGCLRH